VARAESGDPQLADCWQQVTEAVGLGAVALAHMFCPEVIVVGGGFGEESSGLRAAAEAIVAARGPQHLPRPIVVVPASLGRDAGLRGAAAWQRAAGWQQEAGWQAMG
jgi:predicted NBD/HSP70 family sugar kinase